jgi:hypothetical protein
MDQNWWESLHGRVMKEIVPLTQHIMLEPWMVTCVFHLDVSKYAVKRPTWNEGVYFKGRFASCSNVHKHEPFQEMKLAM